MRKGIFTLLLAFSLAFASNTKEKIKDSKNSLRSSQAMSEQLSKKLDDLAGDIVNGEKKLRGISGDITNLKGQISVLETNASKALIELDDLTKQNKELERTQKELEQNMIRIIAEDLSFDLLMSATEGKQSEESVISSQILTKLNAITKEDFKRLSQNYEDTIEKIKNKSNKINEINSSIKNYRRKQSDLQNLESTQKNTINGLKRDKEIYSKKLAKLQAQQDELRKTLEQLAIMQKQEDEAARAAREKQEKAAASKGSKKGEKSQPMGGGYQTSSVKKYSGTKTIAPLDSYTVKQKFGNYVDPIYNIKIFNESVTLRSITPDAKVKSVLNGKVVFAKATPMLENVVIIENENGIHTIYAHLSQIAPTVKVGSVVQKGYVIGRVRNDLTFEVTQRNYHIDPLEMISK
ncbi:murein hydrolase activator EnvC family protein [Campylobacter concisus]|jgi:peptidase, M23/M37 family|uniref:murein hydrolase activator EnvC family protein n=1 Tax=Campylobacter concisus TaxID=199 RepID=UPI000D31E81F|nr:peptidoglycan DD-metalloendopeptidase family protein [Campylobacter concisus]